MMYAQLGNIQFELLPIESLDERISYSYAEHQVIEGKPLLQYIGDNLDETNIGIRFHIDFCDPAGQFKALRAEADLHQALPLIFADGTYLGRRVITELTKTVVFTADNGRPLCIEARLSMREWVSINPLQLKKQQQKATAPARKKTKRHPKAKVAEIPQLDDASTRAGYRLVDKNRIVRL